MPAISMFYGIVIYMYFYDNKKHNKPHIHAEFAEHKGVFSIETTELIEGSLPGKKIKIVQAWMAIHEEELLANWKLSCEGKSPFHIEPLR